MVVLVSAIVAKTVAIIAPLLSSVMHLPQLFKTMKHKSVRDVSFYTIALLLIVEILWLVHGWFIDDLALMLSGMAQVFCVSCLAGMYLMYL